MQAISNLKSLEDPKEAERQRTFERFVDLSTMPSRKRNKGRARKANRQAQSKATLSTQEQDVDCLHGRPPQLPDAEHPVYQFVKALCDYGDSFLGATCLFASLGRGWATMVDGMSDVINCTFDKFPEVWSNDLNRAMAKHHIIASATRSLLNGADYSDLLEARYLTIAVHALENYEPDTRYSIGGMEMLRMTDLLDRRCDRAFLKFYSKRTPCSCLEDRFESILSKPKTGRCSHCYEKKEVGELQVCGRCKMHQYCSRRCQSLRWPDHKAECKPLD
ncbi:hypothetical protein ACHAWF_004839 [Thalassiosira exigua]